MDTELDGKLPCTLQAIVDNLPLGESHALAHRFNLSFGIGTSDASKQAERLRGRLEQMMLRTRRKIKGRKFQTEVIYSLTSRQDAMIVCAVVTRIQ